MKPDEATQWLAGHTIWNVARWLEVHDSGEPYVIFDNEHHYGYRMTVQRITYAEGGPDDPVQQQHPS